MEHNLSMEQLLDCFIFPSFSSEEEKLKDCIIEIASIYDKCKRHQYHMIARYLSSRSENPDTIEYMLCNIQIVDIYLKAHIDEIDAILDEKGLSINSEEILIKLAKLYDHIALEEERLEANMKIMNDSTEVARRRLTEEFSEISQQFRDKIRDLSSEQNANTITIIGLFSAIIFVFFGGVTSFATIVSGFFDLKTKEDLTIPLMLTLLMALFIFDLIFLLLYSVSKLVGKNIGRTCETVWVQYYYATKDEYTEVWYAKRNIDDVILKSGTEEKMRKYCKRKIFYSTVRASIINAFKVLIIRFPHITLPNIIVLYIVFVLYMRIS